MKQAEGGLRQGSKGSGGRSSDQSTSVPRSKREKNTVCKRGLRPHEKTAGEKLHVVCVGNVVAEELEARARMEKLI